MPCPTCAHTMQSITDLVFWCPRCGTIRDGSHCDAPVLVGRLIEFAGNLSDEHQHLIDEFERLGIRDSITLDGMF
jgi:tRNA(Ile2) C34 agmatinyltransferase TiaS